LILSEAELVAAVTRDRAAGKRIGFVAVWFDLLRVGEVRRIQTAAGRADCVVVAVADDEQPHVITLEDRAELVDSLRGVAYVTVCPSSGVETLVALLAPDVRS
jgi:bifunctional ADP-heptose synthase (sugar kinase/adenylyltransferase)